MATDLIAWAKLIAFTDHPTLARCEIATFRYAVLHVAARITHGARQVRLRTDNHHRGHTALKGHSPASRVPNLRGDT